MKSLLYRVWRQDEGVLTFEWVLLVTVLVLGIVGGLSAVRDAVVTELGDVAEGVVALDQSYSALYPWEVKAADCAEDGGSNSAYTDSAGISNRRASTSFIDQVGGDCRPVAH